MIIRAVGLVPVVLLLMAQGAWADAKVIVDRNEGDNATPAFKFERVPAPARDDAAARAKFTIVDGERDPNGGDLDQLNDGQLPSSSDEPATNFFFSQATDTGRLGIDLGSIIDVKQINTYSWHTDTRGPQVYKLYASDGSASGFNPAPKNGNDPTQAGWKLIASVDTRPAQGDPGGQYGVSISDPAGSLGKFRYLLMETSRTEHDDPFGNTFYSEIDVIDGNAPATAPKPGSRPAEKSKYTIIIDMSQMPELKDWAETTLRPVLEKWYPIIVQMLPSDGYSAPQRFTVTFFPDMDGVADTSGTRIRCAGPWFKKNLRGEAIGAVVHEMVHVVQQYRHRNPGWLVEGMADYVRWFKYEPVSKRPHPNPAKTHYDDSYRTTAAFINFVAETHDKDIARKLNAAMRNGTYSPDLWKQYTGKTPEELWAEYAAKFHRK